MPSAEGQGRAKAAWDAYARTSNKVLGPAVELLAGPAIKSYSAAMVSDLIGFWVLWQLEGGFEGLRRIGMSRASIYRKTSSFRKLFGVHPDEFELPGLTLSVEGYRAGAEEAEKRRQEAIKKTRSRKS